MAMPRRISADAARKDAVDGRATLVSGYSRGRYDQWHLEGAIPLEEYASQPRDRELIFYCA